MIEKNTSTDTVFVMDDATRDLLHSALVELCRRIENCGSSPALTHASGLASDLIQAVGDKHYRPDSSALARVVRELQRNEAGKKVADNPDFLEEATDLLRSAYAIALRGGHHTRWDAWLSRLETVLVAQSIELNETSYLPAATCTAKTFITRKDAAIGEGNGETNAEIISLKRLLYSLVQDAGGKLCIRNVAQDVCSYPDDLVITRQLGSYTIDLSLAPRPKDDLNDGLKT